MDFGHIVGFFGKIHVLKLKTWIFPKKPTI